MSKTIQFNPELFKVSGSRKRSKIQIKPKTPSNKSIKSKLLKYLRAEQHKHIKAEQCVDECATKSAKVDDFNSEFNESLKYLLSIDEKKEVKNKTLKHSYNAPIECVLPSELTDISQYMMPTDDNSYAYIPPLKRAPAPQCGVLKNGLLPTYRNFHKTQKKYASYSANNVSSFAPSYAPSYSANNASSFAPSFAPSYSANKASSLAPSYAPSLAPSLAHGLTSISTIKQHMKYKKPEIKHKKQRKTIRRTFKAGKSEYKPIVSVLISNRTIRNNINTQLQLLTQTPIQEVKNALLKKGFIKVGTTAPNDVLRKMYESTIMIGDIQNHNSENLLYNFIHAKL